MCILKSIRTQVLAGLFIMLQFYSCKEFIQIEPPKNQAELSRLFDDDQTANSATVGIYQQLVASGLSFCNGGITIYTGLSADEIMNINSSATADAFKNNILMADNSTISSTFWSNPYKNIYQSNAVIEGLQHSVGLTQNLKQKLQGEMLYIRALHYFYLVNLMAEVPLVVSTDFQLNSIMPRTTQVKVYQQIREDLQKAILLLANSYPSSSNTRPSQGAAIALLARVYLYEKNWEDAEIQATKVINSGKYNIDELKNVFLSNSTETIFQLSKQTSNTAEGASFIPSSATAKPTYTITNHLKLAFEAGDNRETSWLKTSIINGQTYLYPYKYKIRSSVTVSESYIVQRLAEIYLIRAEARIQLNKISEGIDDLDVIRKRAGIPLIKVTRPEINKAALLDVVLKERQTELFAEWGHRWFDLKRTGKADEILGIIKAPNWQPTDLFYPIPLTELQKNPFLTQNNGYFN